MSLETRVQGSTGVRAAQHDIFISYNHEHNDLARSLKGALQRLAKHWYQRRARDVFLDSAKLSTGTGESTYSSTMSVA